jgi:hypothetical protein
VNSPIAAAVGRELSAEEARVYLDQPIAPEEREEILALVRWFTTRYPTPALRLAYVRRAYARWTRATGAATTRASHDPDTTSIPP